MVLLSDGEDHAGDFVDEAKKMKKEGTHFFAVGVGMNSPVEIPLNESSGVKKDAHGKAVKTTFREESLKMLALETGGFYFHSKADHMVYTELAEKINNISASSRWIMEPVERLPLAQYFLAAGLFFVCAETMTGIGRGKPR